MYTNPQHTPIGQPYATKGQRRELMEARVCHKPSEVQHFRFAWSCSPDVTVQTYRRTIKAGGFALSVTVCLALAREVAR